MNELRTQDCSPFSVLFVHLAMLPYSSTIRKDRIRSIFAIENLNNNNL